MLNILPLAIIKNFLKAVFKSILFRGFIMIIFIYMVLETFYLGDKNGKTKQPHADL